MDSNRHFSPLLICHGMLGSRHNWTSMAKQIHKKTGRRVLTVDARNHGDSPHTDTMSYPLMGSSEIKYFILKDLKLGPVVSIMGHSMGGRTAMMLSMLEQQIVKIDRVVIVDISPVNQKFDVTSSNEWNMEHYFHCLKNVTFDQSMKISEARKFADTQLSLRIPDAALRSWLLMNMRQDFKTREIGWRINIDGIHAAFKSEIATIKFTENCVPLYPGPSLFVGGADSEYIPLSDHEEIRERFPEAIFKYVPGAGHWVHSQKPAEFLNTILPFLKE
ncbi:protein ABHD11 [Eurytemora carolleeae]|uniref:protein ABHD11 n=1 Tax=Eurytemora carolleeae TaxID=1294199 RepID=UPI000C76C5C9|nr:protein ABHD11 [Eurytemora carolleeae]|eukprot:XP_023337477.1 protein ABHD11-like [Eurytemora affinis]